MRKIILSGLVIILLLSWTYAALSQRPEAPSGETKSVANENAELEDLAKRMIIQQQESRENLRRLAEGQIKSIEVGEIKQNEKQVFIQALYSDQTSLDGRIDLESIQGKLYITRVTRLSNIPQLPGQQVAVIGDQELNLGRELIKSQEKEQEVPTDLLNGKIKSINISNTTQENQDSIRVEATAAFKDGTSKPLKINMVFLNGYWYIKSFSF